MTEHGFGAGRPATQPRVLAPEPLEFVSEEEMQALIAATDLEFAELEARAAESTAAADFAEEQARALGFDDRGVVGAMASLERFLNGWRVEVDQDADTILSAARHGARLRRDDAHAEAVRVRRARASSPVAAAPPAPPAAEAPLLEPPPHSSFEPLAPRPEAGAADAVGEVGVAGPAPKVETAVVPVTSNGNGVVAPQQLADVVPPAAPAKPLEPDAKQQPATSASAPDEARGEFWPAQEKPKKAGRLSRIPLSAVLEVIAVLLILAFILLRLS